MTESSPCATLGVGKGDAASPSERRTACGSNTNMFGSWDDSVGRERSLTGSDVLSSSGHSRQQQACHSVASWRKVHRSRFLSNGNRLPASPSGEALGQGGLISRKSMRYPEGIHSPGRNALGPVSNDVQNLVQLPAVRSEAMQHLRAATDEKSKLPAWRKTISRYILDRMWFNYLVLFLIALNCIFLAMEDPTDHDNKTTLNQVVMVSEYFFASAFTIEMILRILGNGLYAHSFSYLRDPWNVLDCIIVVSALVTIVLEYANIGNGAALNGLRALRLLRPMRAATRVEQAQIIVASLFQSLPQLADVMLLYLFFLLVFGIMSVQLWKGQLSTRCFRPATMEMEPQERICTADLSDSLSYKCPFGYECLEYGNPNYGKTSFDNIGSALLTLFTALTLEGWTDLMYDVSDASSPYASIYFLLIVLAGAFFVVNLALAIINSSFEMNVGIQHEKRAALPSGTVAKGEMQKLAATAKSFSIEAEQFQTTNTQTETPGDTVDSVPLPHALQKLG
ncbi:Voltage-dependent calcium channel type D subunit alpha-1 [Diplonema papillatum]|nr:Voltage-dependent calcium channel type D subunit alpha-1 [Diplonema papillatum]